MDKKSKLILKELISKRQKEIRDELKGLKGVGSLFIRHLDCGSCNACERELSLLSTPLYDANKWGIHFVSSPRHADLLVLTGPYVRSLDQAALRTLQAMPVPRIVTIGDCAGKNSEFEKAYAVIPYPDEIKRAIIKHIEGCPPEPYKILKELVQIKKIFNLDR